MANVDLYIEAYGSLWIHTWWFGANCMPISSVDTQNLEYFQGK